MNHATHNFGQSIVSLDDHSTWERRVDAARRAVRDPRTNPERLLRCICTLAASDRPEDKEEARIAHAKALRQTLHRVTIKFIGMLLAVIGALTALVLVTL